jgi:tetratricopeptide (TPR) repeat protein
MLKGVRVDLLFFPLAAGLALAQTEGKTASEVLVMVEADLRGGAQDLRSPVLQESTGIAVPFAVRAGEGGVVSVGTLRHKIPKKAVQAFKRAAMLSSAGRYQQAIGELRLAVRLDPEFAQAHANLGVQYARLGRYAEAQGELDRSVALDPASSEAYSNLAWAQLGSGETSAAEASARRALEISSGNDQARYLLGLALIWRPETRDEGIRHLELAARSIAAAARILRELGWK